MNGWWWFLLGFALPAVGVALGPETWRHALLFDRDAILAGQVWRLWTGHWVHHSMSHLGWNLGALAVVVPWLADSRPAWLPRYLPGAAPLISLVLLAGLPDLHTYAGLSGLGTGVVVMLGWSLSRQGPTAVDRGWGRAMLGLVAAKLLFDLLHEGALLSRFDAATVRPVPLAHIVGAVTALLAVERFGKVPQVRRG